MGRILFASVPLSGHVYPALQLVSMLAGRGHDVAFYTGSRFRKEVEEAGAVFFPVKRGKDFDDRDIRRAFPGIPRRPLLKHSKYYMRHVFIGEMKNQMEDLEEIASRFRPSLVVSDEWFTGSTPFAMKNNLPLAVYSNSPLMLMNDKIPAPGAGLFPDDTVYGRYRNRIVNFMMKKILFRDLQRFFNKQRLACGIPPVPYFFLEHVMHAPRQLIKFHTPAFEYPLGEMPANLFFAGPVLPPAGANGFDNSMLAANRGARPVIFITQGSVDNENYRKLIEPALRATAAMNVITVVAAGDRHADVLKEKFPGENILISPFVPYAAVMPFVDVMITNGGYGGVITALTYGVPLIVAGNSEDKPVVASRVSWTGCGISLNTGNPGAAGIGKAIREILVKPAYKAKAMEIAADFSKYDGVRRSVDKLEALMAVSTRLTLDTSAAVSQGV